MNNEKQDIINKVLDDCQKKGFTGNIQINFDQGRINNRINIKHSQLLLDKYNNK